MKINSLHIPKLLSLFVLLALSLLSLKSVAPVPEEIREPSLILIEGGEFKMGDKDGEGDARPVHKVLVSSFYLAKYEVTNEEFVEFLNSIKVEVRNGEDVFYRGKQIYDLMCDGFCSNWQHEIYLEEGRFKLRVGSERFPVVLVSWYGAVTYAQWLSQRTGKSYRLPTEEEWEYAAGCGKMHQKWAGTNSGGKSISKFANICDASCAVKNWRDHTLNDGYAYTAPVGSFKPNKWGLYDMTGNVHEWCSTVYYPSYAPTPEEKKASEEEKNYVFRGGSWINNLASSKTTARFSANPDYCTTVVGFRLARDVQ